eukprot:gene6894-13989_t
MIGSYFRGLWNDQSNSSKMYHTPPSPTQKKIGLIPLVILIFYAVSGGAFGIEDIVRAGGPLFALCGFVLLLVWAIPEALITVELATALPESSGSVAWVTTAFGDFWGFQKGWLSWLSGVTDNALYPILFLDTLLELFKDSDNDDGNMNGLESGWYRSLFIGFITIFLTLVNYMGLDVVGKTAIVVCVLSMIPFVLFCIIGAFSVQPHRWTVQPPDGFTGVNWRLFLNTFFWNINYWESVACFSADVHNPAQTFPRGMFLAILLVFLMTFIPVLIGTGASDLPYGSWSDGCFARLAADIVGPWLGMWMVLGSAISNIGMFEAEMSTDAWQIAGMADRGILPSCLGVRNIYGTPTIGILMSATGILFLSEMSFTEVVEMLNLLYCFGQIIEFAAFVQLRISHPDLHRPYKIPLGFSSLSVFLRGIGASVMGGVVYWMLDVAKQRGWLVFHDRFTSESSSLLLYHRDSDSSGEGYNGADGCGDGLRHGSGDSDDSIGGIGGSGGVLESEQKHVLTQWRM